MNDAQYEPELTEIDLIELENEYGGVCPDAAKEIRHLRKANAALQFAVHRMQAELKALQAAIKTLKRLECEND